MLLPCRAIASIIGKVQYFNKIDERFTYTIFILPKFLWGSEEENQEIGKIYLQFFDVQSIA